MRRTILLLATLTALASGASTRPAAGADVLLRIAVIANDAALAKEFTAGVELAVAASNDAKLAGGKRPSVETLSLVIEAHTSPTAAIEKAAANKCAGVVACATEAVAIEMEAAARKDKIPLVLVGPGGPTRTLDPNDPVFRVEPSAAERGLALAEWLRLKSAKASVGLPAATKKAWLVVEDAAWAKAVAAALRADDVDRLLADLPENELWSAMGDDGADAARKGGCDRVVVIGGAPKLDAVCTSLDRQSWDVPILCLDAALDGVQGKPRRRAAYLAATPTWTDDKQLEQLATRHATSGKPGPPTPTAVRAFAAASGLIEAAVVSGKKSAVPALRDVHEGSAATEWPLFDETGTTDRWRWTAWIAGEAGVAPIKPTFVPDMRFGCFLGKGQEQRFHAADGCVCVKVGYGGGAGQPPRTVEADLATLGFGDGASKAAFLAREQILVRTASKLSRVWGRSRDGSAKPFGFKIAFVPELPSTTTKGASIVWDAVCAGDGPEGAHGGIAFPGKNPHCQAFSTYLIRRAGALQQGKLSPPLSDADLTYLDGSYAWNGSPEANFRADQIRALLEGVASTYCMKLSKELGHLAGLDIDKSGDPRSVMVTKGGEGVSDEYAYFPPANVKVLEKTLGRLGADGK